MHSFSDRDGRTWNVELTIGSARRLKSELGVDVLNFTDGGDKSALVRLIADVETFVSSLFVLCKTQIEAAGLDDDGFAEVLSGDVFESAWEAMRRELSHFFQKLGKTQFASALEKTAEIVSQSQAKIAKRVESLDVEQLSETAARTLTDGPLFTNSPALSESSRTT